jgi:phage repressor protein C with HTH and peptisase S24 domain
MLRLVRGDSMLPLLKPGRMVVGAGRYAVLRPGDVVIISHGGLEKIKRIQSISRQHLFLVGDNQERSTDSRKFGWLHVSVVQAKVVWPRVLKRPLTPWPR